jgi:hypothetical protein
MPGIKVLLLVSGAAQRSKDRQALAPRGRCVTYNSSSLNSATIALQDARNNLKTVGNAVPHFPKEQLLVCLEISF